MKKKLHCPFPWYILLPRFKRVHSTLKNHLISGWFKLDTATSQKKGYMISLPSILIIHTPYGQDRDLMKYWPKKYYVNRKNIVMGIVHVIYVVESSCNFRKMSKHHQFWTIEQQDIGFRCMYRQGDTHLVS